LLPKNPASSPAGPRATPPATAFPNPKPALFPVMDVLRHFGHLGELLPLSTRPLIGILGSSHVGEKRSIKATLQPQRVHFPSLIVCIWLAVIIVTPILNHLTSRIYSSKAMRRNYGE